MCSIYDILRATCHTRSGFRSYFDVFIDIIVSWHGFIVYYNYKLEYDVQNDEADKKKALSIYPETTKSLEIIWN